MDSIRIDIGIKRIAINDDPNNVIEFNPADVTFAERFYNLIGELENKTEEYKRRGEAIEAVKEVDANGIPVNFDERLKLLRETCEYMRDKIDQLFGEGTSQKVFGDAMVLDMFEQFFTGITPFIEAARSEKIQKYRKVSHSKRVMS